MLSSFGAYPTVFFQPSFLIILYVDYVLNTICILKRVVLPWDPIYRYDFMCIFSFHLIFIIHHIVCWLFVVICQFLLAIKTDLGTRYNPIIRNNVFFINKATYDQLPHRFTASPTSDYKMKHSTIYLFKLNFFFICENCIIYKGLPCRWFLSLTNIEQCLLIKFILALYWSCVTY